MSELTDRQQRVLDAINAYWKKNHRSPSIRDLCDSLGIKSPNGVQQHLDALQKKDAITRSGDGSSRSIVTAEVREALNRL